MICIVATTAAQAGTWAILDDNRVGRVTSETADRVTLKLEDGSVIDVAPDAIAELLEDAKLRKEVRALMIGMGRDVSRARSMQRLTALGPAAAHHLIFYLTGEDDRFRLMAAIGLQFAWTDQAIEPLKTHGLRSHDPMVKQLAFNCFRKHLKGERLVAVIDPLTKDPDPTIAGPAVALLEQSEPSLQRMVEAMSRRRMWPFLGEALPRYYTSKLLEPTQQMLMRGREKERIAAIASLIAQGAVDTKTQSLVQRMLRQNRAALREIAAEYLRLHGEAKALAALEKARDQERDRYAKAAMHAAIEAITLRARRVQTGEADFVDDAEAELAQRYLAALTSLSKQPNKPNEYAARKLLRDAESHAKRYTFGDDPSDLDIAAIQARAALMTRVAGYELPDVLGQFSPEANEQTWANITWDGKSFSSPVRGFLDEKAERQPFGNVIPPHSPTPFANSVHVGDDAAMHRPYGVVLAMAPGVVRYANRCQNSWGGLVVIEHQRPDGSRVCTLYGHLAPVLTVKHGQVVEAGQMIGSLGRSHCYENGGYGAHLHAAMHQSPFERGQWVRGYIDVDTFRSGDHGWVDPYAAVLGKLHHPAP